MKVRIAVLSLFSGLLLLIAILAGFSFRTVLSSIFPPIFTIYMDQPVENAEFRLYYYLERGFNDKDSLSVNITSENASSLVSFRLPTTAASTVKLRIRGLQQVNIKSISFGTLEWSVDDIVRTFYPGETVSRFGVEDGLLKVASTGKEISLQYSGNITNDFVSSAEKLLFTYFVILAVWLFLFLFTDAILAWRHTPGWFVQGKAANIILITGFLLALFTPLAGYFTGVESKLSNTENRELAKLPELSIAGLSEFPAKFESNFNDNFGLRSILVRWNSMMRIGLFQQSPVSWVVIGKNGWLFLNNLNNIEDCRGFLHYTNEELRTITHNFEEQQEWLNKQGISYLVVIVPDKETIYPEYLPDSIRRTNGKTRLDQLIDYLQKNSDFRVLDLRQPLLEAKNGKYSTFYRTDGHWNDYGAFIGYREIMLALKQHFPDISPLGEDDYAIVVRPCSGRERLTRLVQEACTTMKRYYSYPGQMF